jgi:hypothetical protein
MIVQIGEVYSTSLNMTSKHTMSMQVNKNDFSGPWYARWLFYIRNGIDDRGGDVNAATHMHDWVKSNPAFEDMIYHEHFLSVIPPPRDGPNAAFMQRCDRDMSRNVLVSPLASQVYDRLTKWTVICSRRLNALDEVRLPTRVCFGFGEQCRAGDLGK